MYNPICLIFCFKPIIVALDAIFSKEAIVILSEVKTSFFIINAEKNVFMNENLDKMILLTNCNDNNSN